MKHMLILSILSLILLVGCNKQQTSDTDKLARTFKSEIADYTCDLLYDAVDVHQLIDAKFFDSDPENALEPLSAHNEQYIQYGGFLYVGQCYADYYNAIMMMNNLFSDMETAVRFDGEIDNIYNLIADSMQLLDYSIIYNDTLEDLIHKCKDAMIAYVRSETRNDDATVCYEEFYDYINEHIAPVIAQTQEAHSRYMNRDSIFDDYEAMCAKRGKSDTIYQQELLTKLYLTPDEDVAMRHAYAIEFAHSSSQNSYYLIGAAVLHKEMLEGYSPYTPEMWQTWRAILTTLAGMSSFAYLPNLPYNMVRKAAAQTCISHLDGHPDDLLAQGIIIHLAGIDNIIRQGSLFGNSNLVEQMTIFPEWNDKIEEADSINKGNYENE